MRFYIIASGSKGNSTLITDGATNLLIDMGLTKKWLLEGLSQTPIGFNDIHFALFTHDHGDHASGQKFLPIEKRYATKGSVELLEGHELEHYKSIKLGTFTITPLPTSHDANDGVGFLIFDGRQTLVYMTDTGYISNANMSYMKNADYYIIESNHNVKMLLQTDRTFTLIQRILGDTGHLSNEDSAMYMSELLGDRTKEIILAHLSEEANDPEVALKAHLKIYQRKYIDIDKIRIVPAKQYELVSGGHD
ncbi:MAG TPA: MBL fold metallo-hydrolase [Firmicutes bacterium]|jgi:phosphoribosyl 1,2-cyclic phosphodiesterase|nr:MBL fold metallo-hydrolase [Bacillota bacterium]